jgi:hypothetical protein
MLSTVWGWRRYSRFDSDIVKVRRRSFRIPKDTRLGDVENKYEGNVLVGVIVPMDGHLIYFQMWFGNLLLLFLGSLHETELQ